MPMEFFKTIERASFLSPPDFNQVSEEMEYRKDPLTGISCRINRLLCKLISRPVMTPTYRNDTGSLERLHYLSDIELSPELLANYMKEYFPGE